MLKKVLFGLAIGAAGLCLASTAQAGAPAVVKKVAAHPGRPYYRTHGVRFSGGYYYRGHDHHHWGQRVWSPVYRRYHYWDPYLRVYFYWCPQRDCYYPITYVS